MMGAERQGNAMRRIWSRAVALVLCAGMLTGCSRLMTWTIFDTVNLVKDTFNGDHDGDGDSDWSEHSINDSEDYLMEGDNVFSLDPYPLEEGVAPLLEEIDKRLGSLLNSRFNVDAVRLDVDPSGNVTGAGLLICQVKPVKFAECNCGSAGIWAPSPALTVDSRWSGTAASGC